MEVTKNPNTVDLKELKTKKIEEETTLGNGRKCVF